MTHVETKVSLSISQNGMNLKELEQEIGKTLNKQDSSSCFKPVRFWKNS